MSRTEAERRAQQKYEQARKKISLRMSAAKLEEIKAYAGERGESVAGFAMRAIDETMERDEEEV